MMSCLLVVNIRMDRVYRMLQESRRMSAAAAGVILGENGEKCKNSVKAHGLTEDEKLFLHAVERGDTERMRRYVELVKHSKTPVQDFNINCVDPLGRFVMRFTHQFITHCSHTAQCIHMTFMPKGQQITMTKNHVHIAYTNYKTRLSGLTYLVLREFVLTCIFNSVYLG